VYHDLGNLNFTFLTVRRDYDVARQTETILQAVRALGIPAEKNGRNDLTAAGGKFSGHAYYQTGEQCYHHGTLMVSVDLSPLAAYLQVSPLKLEAKGVKSVRARVVNLTQFRPELTVAQLRQALVEAFGRVYGLPVHPLRTDQLDAQALARGRARFADPAWVYGDSRPLAVSREARFTWGLLRLDYSQAEGSITQAALWSDGLEADFLSQVPGALQGCPRQPAAVRARLMALKGAERTLVEDILTLLMEEA
ncbi:MAG: lipoyl protein ligase domain-containing protein, partial [Evtepia gabavorous]